MMLPRKTVFIGNPGRGKSTLLNALVGRPVFRSGISIGHGLTSVMQMEEVDGEFWGDTPGLDDKWKREQAAEEIAKALRHGLGEYRLVFILTEESLRVRPEDLTTMSLILDAIKARNGKSVPFGIILNKVEVNLKQRVESDETSINLVNSMVQPEGYPPAPVLLYPRVESLVGQDDFVHQPSKELVMFIDNIPSIVVSPDDVADIDYNAFDDLKKKYSDVLKERQTQKNWIVLLATVGLAATAGAAGIAWVSATAVAAAENAAAAAAAEAALAAATAAETSYVASFFQGLGAVAGVVAMAFGL